MSYTFRDRPRLSDRFRGKSGDDLINEIRQEFNQDPRMFYETNTNWPTSHFPRTGFPFDDDSMPRTRQDIRSHLDDLAARHPEFADHLRGPPWAGDIGSSWGKKRKETGSCDEDEFMGQPRASNEPPQPGCTDDSGARGRPKNLNQYGLRNTVPLGPNKSDVDTEETRGQRSMSAPPDGRTQTTPQRFVSRLNITPVNPDAPQRHQQTAAPQESNENASKPPRPTSNVRHIPIFVEGRDKPVIPKEYEKQHESSKPQPNISHQPKPAEKEFERRIPVNHGIPKPQPNVCNQQASQAKPPSPQAPSKKADQQPDFQPQEQRPSPKPEFNNNDPICKVQAIQKDVEELKVQVEKFAGTSKDKEYVYLDEMLTRNILKLDDIETEGKENIRQARKDAIRSIQRCISVLESKVAQPASTQGEASNEAIEETNEESQLENVVPDEKTAQEELPQVSSSTDVDMTENVGSTTEESTQVPMETQVAEETKVDSQTESVGERNEVSSTTEFAESQAKPSAENMETEPVVEKNTGVKME